MKITYSELYWVHYIRFYLKGTKSILQLRQTEGFFFLYSIFVLDINECDSNPCVNGECQDGNNRYSCQCNDGWTGDNCDISESE